MNGREHEPTEIDGVVDALKEIAFRLKYLGNGDAATTMGAIEVLSVSVQEAGKALADAHREAIHELAEAIRFHAIETE